MQTLKKGIERTAIRSTLLVFMIIWSLLLYSCVATVRTPRHTNSTVIIEKHDNGLHKGHQKHQK
ncbi:MAG: hypothetical protein M0Q53_03575 [Prolixibacteraceae bacterium]|nr:hypothetical protein [Prolixibacteraceae bacterium]